MSTPAGVEDELRDLAPQGLGALVRRYGGFDTCEDAVQEALLAAAVQWPAEGVPGNPKRGRVFRLCHSMPVPRGSSERGSAPFCPVPLCTRCTTRCTLDHLRHPLVAHPQDRAETPERQLRLISPPNLLVPLLPKLAERPLKFG